MAALNIQSPDYFTIDGVSSETVGLYVDTPPIPPLAKQRYTTYKTGVDMDVSTPDDVFENITLSFSCFMFMKNDDFSLSAVYGFLQSGNKLAFSRFPNRYFKIQQLGGVNPSQQYDGNKIKLSVSFICSPFKYHTSNDEISPENNIINNPGTRYSRPLYKIVKSSAGSAASITVNQTDTLQLLATSPQAVTVDAEHMIAFETSGTHDNCTRFTYGLFPFLSPGANVITCDGCTVTVIGNWRDF